MQYCFHVFLSSCAGIFPCFRWRLPVENYDQFSFFLFHILSFVTWSLFLLTMIALFSWNDRFNTILLNAISIVSQQIQRENNKISSKTFAVYSDVRFCTASLVRRSNGCFVRQRLCIPEHIVVGKIRRAWFFSVPAYRILKISHKVVPRTGFLNWGETGSSLLLELLRFRVQVLLNLGEPQSVRQFASHTSSCVRRLVINLVWRSLRKEPWRTIAEIVFEVTWHSGEVSEQNLSSCEGVNPTEKKNPNASNRRPFMQNQGQTVCSRTLNLALPISNNTAFALFLVQAFVDFRTAFVKGR